MTTARINPIGDHEMSTNLPPVPGAIPPPPPPAGNPRRAEDARAAALDLAIRTYPHLTPAATFTEQSTNRTQAVTAAGDAILALADRYARFITGGTQ